MIYPRAMCLAAAAFLFLSAAAQTSHPREHFENATVMYDWVSNQHGEKLRTFVTRPNHAAGKVPAIFFVGWLSCDSVEYPDANTHDGFGIFLRRLIEESGYATVRMDKPGVGESQGNCAKADFQSEMEGFQAAFDSMAKFDFIDMDRILVVGLSNGGGFSPMPARDHPVRGFISCGAWGRTWFEHMLDMERRRLTEKGTPPAEVNAAVKAFAEFYDLYLVKKMTPGQVIAQHPEWKQLWYDAPDGQYGRPAAFYQQLQSLNLGEVWQRVNAPVLVIRGANDTIMSRTDSETIVGIVNQAHPGRAIYRQIEGMTHGFTVNGKFSDEVVPIVLLWMKEQLAASR
ncbi:MAG TPA: alpha/beta hydrolase [Candidatus Angelobacter sp.]|nr:alpha/beta hydrolase [Candidatus Angelobacter sp.]